jgi:hypothetical protein
LCDLACPTNPVRPNRRMSRQDLIRKARTILTPWMNPSTRTARGRSRTFCLENPPIRFPDSEEKLCGGMDRQRLGAAEQDPRKCKRQCIRRHSLMYCSRRHSLLADRILSRLKHGIGACNVSTRTPDCSTPCRNAQNLNRAGNHVYHARTLSWSPAG